MAQHAMQPFVNILSPLIITVIVKNNKFNA